MGRLTPWMCKRLRVDRGMAFSARTPQSLHTRFVRPGVIAFVRCIHTERHLLSAAVWDADEVVVPGLGGAPASCGLIFGVPPESVIGGGSMRGQ